MAGSQARSPAANWDERDVEALRGKLCHLGKQVGVAREVEAPASGHEKPQRHGSEARRRAPVLRLRCAHGDSVYGGRLARAELADADTSMPPEPAGTALRPHDEGSRIQQSKRMGIVVIPVEMREKDGVESLSPGRIQRAPLCTEKRRPVAEQRIGEQADSVQLNEHGRVPYQRQAHAAWDPGIGGCLLSERIESDSPGDYLDRDAVAGKPERDFLGIDATAVRAVGGHIDMRGIGVRGTPAAIGFHYRPPEPHPAENPVPNPLEEALPVDIEVSSGTFCVLCRVDATVAGDRGGFVRLPTAPGTSQEPPRWVFAAGSQLLAGRPGDVEDDAPEKEGAGPLHDKPGAPPDGGFDEIRRRDLHFVGAFSGVLVGFSGGFSCGGPEGASRGTGSSRGSIV